MARNLARDFNNIVSWWLVECNHYHIVFGQTTKKTPKYTKVMCCWPLQWCHDSKTCLMRPGESFKTSDIFFHISIDSIITNHDWSLSGQRPPAFAEPINEWSLYRGFLVHLGISQKYNMILQTISQLWRQNFGLTLNSRKTPKPRPIGRAMGVFRKLFGEKWPRYIGNILQCCGYTYQSRNTPQRKPSCTSMCKY